MLTMALHKRLKHSCQACDVLGLTFPDHQHTPTHSAQLANGKTIPFDIPANLRVPEPLVALRPCAPTATAMPVPEATVYKDRGAPARQNHVRSPRDIAGMKAKAKTPSMETAANIQFRARI